MDEIQVVHMDEGTKIDYEIMGNKIIFDDELMLNLGKYERDDSMHIDVCRDEFGCLCMGLATRYVAQIDIPAREYSYEETGTDEENNPQYEKVAVPFDISKVKLSLWEVQ